MNLIKLLKKIISLYNNEKLTGTEKWFVFWGLAYVVNLNPKSKEIHSLEEKHKNCQVEKISRKRYVSKGEALFFIKNYGYNGCRYCFKQYDKG